jgi:hypothetical protein
MLAKLCSGRIVADSEVSSEPDRRNARLSWPNLKFGHSRRLRKAAYGSRIVERGLLFTIAGGRCTRQLNRAMIWLTAIVGHLRVHRGPDRASKISATNHEIIFRIHRRPGNSCCRSSIVKHCAGEVERDRQSLIHAPKPCRHGQSDRQPKETSVAPLSARVALI